MGYVARPTCSWFYARATRKRTSTPIPKSAQERARAARQSVPRVSTSGPIVAGVLPQTALPARRDRGIDPYRPRQCNQYRECQPAVMDARRCLSTTVPAARTSNVIATTPQSETVGIHSGEPTNS